MRRASGRARFPWLSEELYRYKNLAPRGPYKLPLFFPLISLSRALPLAMARVSPGRTASETMWFPGKGFPSFVVSRQATFSSVFYLVECRRRQCPPSWRQRPRPLHQCYLQRLTWRCVFSVSTKTLRISTESERESAERRKEEGR